MSTQQNGRKLVILTLLVLISACGPADRADQSPEGVRTTVESNGIDTEVVVEQAPKDEDAQASETVLSEEETGIADLREFVDEIAPEPNDSELASPTSSASGTKQDSSPSDNKTDNKTDDQPTVVPPADPQDTPTFMMALADDGLQTVDVQTGSTLDLLFEVDREIAVSTVSTALGDPTETVDTSECPAGPLKITTWSNGFSLNTLDEVFVGWSVRPDLGSENLTTIAGVGIGTSRKNLQDAYDVEIFESSLGTEFNVGQMSGILSSDQPDGEITNLWAGLNCIFR